MITKTLKAAWDSVNVYGSLVKNLKTLFSPNTTYNEKTAAFLTGTVGAVGLAGITVGLIVINAGLAGISPAAGAAIAAGAFISAAGTLCSATANYATNKAII